MVNKKSIWFLTLFSLILVLSIYYITMPNELLMPPTKVDTNKTASVSKETEIKESSILVALRVEEEEEYIKELDVLQNILTNSKSSVEEKNSAFDKMKTLNNIKSEQEALEKKISDEFKLKAFIKIDGDQIRIVVDSKTHDIVLANKIMRLVQSNYTNKMYISVKFSHS